MCSASPPLKYRREVMSIFLLKKRSQLHHSVRGKKRLILSSNLCTHDKVLLRHCLSAQIFMRSTAGAARAHATYTHQAFYYEVRSSNFVSCCRPHAIRFNRRGSETLRISNFGFHTQLWLCSPQEKYRLRLAQHLGLEVAHITQITGKLENAHTR